MRLPRVRFTVRRIMAVVAILALVLGVSVESIRLKRQCDKFRSLAAGHGQQETFYRQMEQSVIELAQIEESSGERTKELNESMSHFVSPRLGGQKVQEMRRRWAEFSEQQKNEAAKDRARAAMHHDSADYHAALKRKYSAAAARPWRSIEPDGPPPDPDTRAPYWSERGNYGLAVAAFREVLKRDPDDASALNGLAWVLASCPDASLRDGKMAVETATRACELSKWTEASFLDTLAAAYAETGDYPSAVRWQREAIAKLSAADPTRAEFSDRLQLYESSKPYRDDAQKGN
jgi:tetratricopeptide (TPR) repeat protein